MMCVFLSYIYYNFTCLANSTVLQMVISHALKNTILKLENLVFFPSEIRHLHLEIEWSVYNFFFKFWKLLAEVPTSKFLVIYLFLRFHKLAGYLFLIIFSIKYNSNKLNILNAILIGANIIKEPPCWNLNFKIRNMVFITNFKRKNN